MLHTLFFFDFLSHSKRLMLPIIFVSKVSVGFKYDIFTSGWEARWKIKSGFTLFKRLLNLILSDILQ